MTQPAITRFHVGNVEVPCRAYDVEANEELKEVTVVDIKNGWVRQAYVPVHVTSHDTIAEYRTRFRRIVPIYGGYDRPCMFHCYGRTSPPGQHGTGQIARAQVVR